jgi:very-long-chain ceramide synthase
MKYVLAPLAKLWGISKRKEVTRFSEQGWILIYYNVFCPLGMVCHTRALYTLRCD